MTDLEPLLSVDEVVDRKLLGLKRTEVYAAVRRRQIDHVRRGKRILFRPEHIAQFIEAHTVSAEPATADSPAPASVVLLPSRRARGPQKRVAS